MYACQKQNLSTISTCHNFNASCTGEWKIWFIGKMIIDKVKPVSNLKFWQRNFTISMIMICLTNWPGNKMPDWRPAVGAHLAYWNCFLKSVCVCMYVCMYMRTYMCMHVCMYACMHSCIFVCISAPMWAKLYKQKAACMWELKAVESLIGR